MPTFAQSRHGLGTLKDGFRGRRTAIATTRDIEHRSTQPVSATLLAPSSLPNRIPASSHCPGQTCLADGGDATMCDEVRHGVPPKRFQRRLMAMLSRRCSRLDIQTTQLAVIDLQRHPHLTGHAVRGSFARSQKITGGCLVQFLTSNP